MQSLAQFTAEVKMGGTFAAVGYMRHSDDIYIIAAWRHWCALKMFALSTVVAVDAAVVATAAAAAMKR